jgi:hypothetical protein
VKTIVCWTSLLNLWKTPTIFILLMNPNNLNLEDPKPIKFCTSLEDPNTQYINIGGLLTA